MPGASPAGPHVRPAGSGPRAEANRLVALMRNASAAGDEHTFDNAAAELIGLINRYTTEEQCAAPSQP